MTIIIMVLRKINKNKWLTLCLLIGLIISIGLVSSIPIYSNGVLQKFLIQEFDKSQKTTGQYPGIYSLTLNFTDKTPDDNKKITFYKVNDFMSKNVNKIFGLKLMSNIVNCSTDKLKLIPVNYTKVDANVERYATVQSANDFEKHIKIIDGRMPSKTEVNGEYEVMVNQTTLDGYATVIGNEFNVSNAYEANDPNTLKVKIVGVYAPKSEADPYWKGCADLITSREVLMINQNLFEKDFINRDKTMLQLCVWSYIFDYHDINLNNIGHLMNADQTIQNNTLNKYGDMGVFSDYMDILNDYLGRQNQLMIMLFVLDVPVILMLLFYIFMVSSLLVEKQKDDIALLRSRGATKWHILLSYLLENGMLSLIAFLVGPLLGYMISKTLGVSNGFMEFVNRTAIPVRVSALSYEYAFFAALIAVITTLIPAYISSGYTIVTQKQESARVVKKALWQRMYLDIILLGISIYALYTFNQRQQILDFTNINATNLNINPLLFCASTLFIIGAGLFLIRIYPYIVSLIYKIGNRLWSTQLYVTLVEISRGSRKYQFLMIFLIMTISTGLFGANAARTINMNVHDRIYYDVGADMVLEPLWDTAKAQGYIVNQAASSTNTNSENKSNSDQNQAKDTNSGSDQSDSDQSSGSGSQSVIVTQYIEPPFSTYQKLNGVQAAARVYTRDDVSVTINNKSEDNVNFMAIDPYDFGHVAWYRNGLMTHHINEYLNLMSSYSPSVLVSDNLSKKYNISVGDNIKVKVLGTQIPCVVYGIIDYWPSWNKYNVQDNADMSSLVVANLPYIQDNTQLDPYNIWLKLKPNATTNDVYNSIVKNNMKVLSIVNANQQLIKAKNDPFQLGINGALTLSFIISIIVCFMGFIIYWILTLSSRVYQFGILRAIGIYYKQLLGMIVWEQVLTSGIALIMGVVVGYLTSRFFVPLFQMAFDASNQVPPFVVVSEIGDKIKLFVSVIVMLIAGFIVIGKLISKIKINQAIKMGED